MLLALTVPATARCGGLSGLTSMEPGQRALLQLLGVDKSCSSNCDDVTLGKKTVKCSHPPAKTSDKSRFDAGDFA